jgi:soluble lytic murein transglycosylase-like protein
MGGMDQSRRNAIKLAVGAALLPFVPGAAEEAKAAPAGLTPINVIIPENYSPPLTGKAARRYEWKLGRAILDFTEEHYRGRNLPVWRRPLEGIDLEKRVVNIVYWIMRGTAESMGIHPLDPAWVAAQIMAESYFYEFAVSWAFAVGPCQFIAPTARRYDMLTAGDRPEHHRPPYSLHEHAMAIERYYDKREHWKHARRIRGKLESDEPMIKQVLKAAILGRPVPDAQQYLRAWERVEELDREVKEARKNFKAYLKANFEGRSIFDKRDLAFLVDFDERVTYRKPVRAMCRMLAENLRARSGNVVAAAAGYNAGLGNTADPSHVYEPYGKIPGFDETVRYVSRILVNHHEIVRRMG